MNFNKKQQKLKKIVFIDGLIYMELMIYAIF